MNEIREGNLFSLPNSINFESWKIAWAGRGEGNTDVFLKPYFFNSLKIAITSLDNFNIFRCFKRICFN